MDDVHELAAAYALDGLDAEERARFEAHLPSCTACREEVDGFRTAAAQLALVDPAPEPPAELRGRLLDAARAERSNVVPLRPRRRSWALPAAAALAAAASVAALGFGLWAASLNRTLDRERSALAIIGDPASRRVGVDGAKGTLYVAPSGDAALAVALPKPPEGKTYEVWVLDPTPRRAALFSGRTTALKLRVRHGAQVAVTVEKAEGVDAPTSKPLLSARA